MTTRGFKEEDFEIVGHLIAKTLRHPDDEKVLEEVKEEVKELTAKHPLYPDLEY